MILRKSSAENNFFVLEIAIFLFIIVSVYLVSAAGDFNCTIIENQTCAFTRVIFMQNDTGGYWNAHAQNVSVGTYDYVICCNSNSSLSYACSQNVFLKLKPTTNFEKCMNITISNAGSSTLANFPAYINLTHDNDMLPDFRDIRFYDSPCNQGGNPLDFEIENYTTNDRAHVWVRIPSLPTEGKNISIYYKNNSFVSSGENPTGVWDSNYVGVWHMKEVNATDSTQYGNDGNESGGVTLNSSGKIDSALSFDGTDEFINISDDDSLSFGNSTTDSPITISAWIKMNDATEFKIFEKGDYDGGTIEYYFRTGDQGSGNDDNLIFRTYDISEGDAIGRQYLTPLTSYEYQWIYVVATYNGNMSTSGIKLYLNGIRIDDYDYDYGSGYVAMENLEAPVWIGRYTTYYANGTIDEVRISDTNRSADWINQSYMMVTNQSNYVTFGAEEDGPGILKGCHVQKGNYSGPGTIYGIDVCLATTPGYFDCTYVDDACPSNRECFASMASSLASDNNDTNAHIGPCQQYQRKICCKVSTKVNVTYEDPTPGNDTRQTANSVIINVSVSTDPDESIDTCILEWKIGNNPANNETMEKVGSGSSVFCNKTKTTIDGTNYYFRVYANDTNGLWGDESQRTFRENARGRSGRTRNLIRWFSITRKITTPPSSTGRPGSTGLRGAMTTGIP